MNLKDEIEYDTIFSSIIELLSFGDRNYKNNFLTITNDNEDALNNNIIKYFPNATRVACYYHYKNNLQMRARELGLKIIQYINETKKIILNLGLLPLVYKGNINFVTKFIDDLKSKYCNYIDSWFNETMKYFISNALN